MRWCPSVCARRVPNCALWNATTWVDWGNHKYSKLKCNETWYLFTKVWTPTWVILFVEEAMSDNSVAHSSQASFNHYPWSTKLDPFPCGGEIKPSQTCHGTHNPWLLAGDSKSFRIQDPRVTNANHEILDLPQVLKSSLALFYSQFWFSLNPPLGFFT